MNLAYNANLLIWHVYSVVKPDAKKVWASTKMQCRLTRKTSLSAFFSLSFLPRYFSPVWLCVCCCCLAPPVRSWSRPLVRALRIAGFGLFSVCAAGLAVAALLPGSVIPLRAAQRCELTLFYKRASSQPANTRWHSLISDRAIDEYLPGERRDLQWQSFNFVAVFRLPFSQHS